MKKAQITLFIIIGIIILAVAAIIFYLISTTEKIEPIQPAVQAKADKLSLQEYASQCLALTVEESARLIAMQGGYLNPRGDPKYDERGDFYPAHYYFDFVPVSYGLIGREIRLPNKQYLENSIERYVIVELDNCLESEFFEKKGFALKKPIVDVYETKIKPDYFPAELDIQVTIAEDKIIAKAKYPVVLESSDERILLEEFTADISLRLGRVHSIAEQIIKEAGFARAGQRLYRITDRCNALSAPDGLINIYFVPNPYRRDYLLRVIDAEPVNTGNLPLKFYTGIRNVEITGECVG